MPTDEKPSRNEDEYFARQNAEQIRAMRAKLDAERKKAASAAQLAKCPRCGGELKEQPVDDVKIDSCSDCGGVWLDRGELEQLRRVNTARGVSGGVLSSLFKRG